MRAQGIVYIAQHKRDRIQREQEERKQEKVRRDLEKLQQLQDDLNKLDDEQNQDSSGRRPSSNQSHNSRNSKLSESRRSRSRSRKSSKAYDAAGKVAPTLEEAFGLVGTCDANVGDSKSFQSPEELKQKSEEKNLAHIATVTSSGGGSGMSGLSGALGSAILIKKATHYQKLLENEETKKQGEEPAQHKTAEKAKSDSGQAQKLGDATNMSINQVIVRRDESVSSMTKSHYNVTYPDKIQVGANEILVGSKVIVRVQKSLCCLSTKNGCRRLSARVSEHRAFDTIIIVLIMLNMISMASRDYLDVNNVSTWNQALENIDYGFSCAFIVEAILKIITSGFIIGKRTYLRDPWNVIDFAIVLAAVIDISLAILKVDGNSLGALKALRILRVLRPLKAVKSMPAIRLQVAALLSSMKQLANVMIFLASMLFLAGVMGLQLFMHSIHFACRETEAPLPGATVWRKVGDDICSRTGNNDVDSYSGFKCPAGTFCGSPLDYGLAPDQDIKYNMQLQYGFGIFQNIGDSFFTVLQMITMDNWTAIMYNLAMHEHLWLPSIFSVFLIFIGSFLLLNLTLAVIMDSYDSTAQQMDLLQKEQLEQEKQELEERINKSKTMQDYANVNQLVFQDQERIMQVFGNKFKDSILKIQQQKKNQDDQQERNKEWIKEQKDSEQSSSYHSDHQSDNSQPPKEAMNEILQEGSKSQAAFTLPPQEDASALHLQTSSSAGHSRQSSMGKFNPAHVSMMKSFGKGLLSNLQGGDTGNERGGSVEVESEAPPKPNPLTQNFAKGMLSGLMKPSDNQDESGQAIASQIMIKMGKQSKVVESRAPVKSPELKESQLASKSSTKVGKMEAQRESEGSVANPDDPFSLQKRDQSQYADGMKTQNNMHSDALFAKSKTLKSSSLTERIGKSLLLQVANQKKELELIRERAQQLKNPEAQAAFGGIEARAEAALDLKNLDDKYAASNQIRLEGNILMLRFQEAFTNKYLQSKGLKSYGLKDEGKTLNIFRQNISQSLKNYKSSLKKPGAAAGEADGGTVQTNSNNPLAAVFAMAAKKKAAEAEAKRKAEGVEDVENLDESVKRGLTKGRIGSEAQIKLVMQIKQNVDRQLEKQKLVAKMTQTIQNIVIQKSEMQQIIEETDAILANDILKLRAQKRFIYRHCLQIEQSRSFLLLISAAIVMNTFVLAMDHYPTSISMLMFIEWANFIFYFVFVIEMVIKLVGLGFKIYLKDVANVFDLLIVIISTVDQILTLFYSGQGGQYKAIQAMRLFRLLRVFKLAKIWPEFAYILVTVGNTIRKISAFLVLFLIFIFSFSILGMELFAAQLSFDENDRPVIGDYAEGVEKMKGTMPDSTFNTFGEAFFSVFIVLANDGWSTIYFNHARMFREEDKSYVLPLVYFISLIIIGQNILFQLFLAILLQEFDERSLIAEENKKRDAQLNRQKQQGPLMKLWLKIKAKCARKKKSDVVQVAPPAPEIPAQQPAEQNQDATNNIVDLTVQEQLINRNDDQQGGGGEVQPTVQSNEDATPDQVAGAENEKAQQPSGQAAADQEQNALPDNKSLFIFSQESSVRKFMRNVELSKKFQNAILVLILISSLTLSQESPLMDPDSWNKLVLTVMDQVMTSFFCMEIIVKVTANGFLINGPKSFMRDFWNCLDFFIVGVAITSLVASDVNLGVFKILRIGKLFRPLRVLSRNEGLKISIQALVVSIPAMLRLLMIVMLFYLIFAVMGINLFKGQLQHCNMSAVTLTKTQQEILIIDKFDCENYGGIWETYYKNFDTLPGSLMQMYTMSRTVGWAEFMYRSARAQGEGLQPGRHFDAFAALYYCFYIIFGAFFITNLFIGVVISTYNREKDRLGNNFLLSEDQKRWIETKLLVTRVKPKRINTRPQNKLRSAMFTFSEHRAFEIMIQLCISLNAILMTIQYVGMSKQVEQIIQIINYCFTGIFFLEMIVRLLAYGRNYFRNYWYVFDFCIVIGSISMIVVQTVHEDASDTANDSASLREAATAARLLRIFRLLRLFRNLKSLQQIFSTFLTTLPHMFNVGGIMLLIVYIYAVIGINLFAQVKPNGILENKFLGFNEFYKSFLTLIRAATGENWNELMNALSRSREPNYDCIEQPTYEDMRAAGGPVGCGDQIQAKLFFVSFIFIVSIIFLNLFIAIILQGYYQTQELDKQVVNREIMSRYRSSWAEFDPDATGFIHASKFGELMFRFGPPLGWSSSFRDKSMKQKLFIKLISQNITTYDQAQFINFSDVLDAVTSFYIIKSEVQAEMQDDGVMFESEDDEEDEVSKSNEVGGNLSNLNSSQDHECSSKGEKCSSKGDSSSSDGSGESSASDKDDGMGQKQERSPRMDSISNQQNSNEWCRKDSNQSQAKKRRKNRKKRGPSQFKNTKTNSKLSMFEDKIKQHEQMLRKAEDLGEVSIVKSLVQKKANKEKRMTKAQFRRDSKFNQMNILNSLSQSKVNSQGKSESSDMDSDSDEIEKTKIGIGNLDSFHSGSDAPQLRSDATSPDRARAVRRNNSIDKLEQEFDAIAGIHDQSRNRHSSLSQKQQTLIQTTANVINEEDEEVEEELARAARDSSRQPRNQSMHGGPAKKTTMLGRSLLHALTGAAGRRVEAQKSQQPTSQQIDSIGSAQNENENPQVNQSGHSDATDLSQALNEEIARMNARDSSQESAQQQRQEEHKEHHNEQFVATLDQAESAAQSIRETNGASSRMQSSNAQAKMQEVNFESD